MMVVKWQMKPPEEMAREITGVELELVNENTGVGPIEITGVDTDEGSMPTTDVDDTSEHQQVEDVAGDTEESHWPYRF